MDKLEVYAKLLKIKPWFQRSNVVVGGAPPAKVYKTYREVDLVAAGSGIWEEAPLVITGGKKEEPEIIILDLLLGSS